MTSTCEVQPPTMRRRLSAGPGSRTAEPGSRRRSRRETGSRSESGRLDVPVVVVVTGSPGPHDDLQASCVLMKPVTPERLGQTVRRCLLAGSSTSAS